MKKIFGKLLEGYAAFRKKYATGDCAVMQQLAERGQTPEIMIVSCCDSRVDPAIILQCDPGDLFVVRNVANIVPPYEVDDRHHGTSAALEFGICNLKIKHLIILGHNQCGGIQALIKKKKDHDDFITNWMSLIKIDKDSTKCDEVAKQALLCSCKNCLSFPWLKARMNNSELALHLWFFDIRTGEIECFSFHEKKFIKLKKYDLAHALLGPEVIA